MFNTKCSHRLCSVLAGGLVALGLISPSFGQTELAKLIASDGATGDQLGGAVDIDGDYAIVGARLEGPPATSGAAYVYRRDTAIGDPLNDYWVQEQKLIARTVSQVSERVTGDEFGVSVAIDGDLAVVGSWKDTHTVGASTIKSGSVYVFRRTGIGPNFWTVEAKLVASDRLVTDRFGASVAIDGDRIVIGADLGDTDPLLTDTGTAYVFFHNGVSWIEEAKLSAIDGEPFDRFAESASISGDTIAVGARGEEPFGLATDDDYGAAYIYRFNGASWDQEAKLTASDAAAGDQFGFSVSANGDTVAVGAPQDSNDVGLGAGGAYVFRRAGITWSEEDKLTASDGFDFDNFGNSVAINGNTLIAAAFQHGGQTGAFYIFNLAGTLWNESAKAMASDGFAPDQFANAVALDENQAIIGSFGDEDELVHPPIANFGSAYIFDVTVAGALDSDGDGLSDDDEANIHGTDPLDDDSDDDGLLDGIEVDLASQPGGCHDPLDADTDNDGLSDGFENDFGPNPCVPDVDADGLLDGQEFNLPAGTPKCHSAADFDSDDDGLSDGAEVNAMVPTDPCNADTDGDGLSDLMELAAGTNATVADTDGDGLSDGDEVTAAAGGSCPNPLLFDTNGDGLSDGTAQTIANRCSSDTDIDGLANLNEAGFGTSPTNPDTDSDSLLDGNEVNIAAGSGCPSPTNPDSDGDGITDGNELTAGLGPCGIDTDDDGLADGNEAGFGTNPLDPDSDNDGLLDGSEFDSAMGGDCPDPMDVDSDDDTLLDGPEVTAGTSPCNPDTDGDGLADNADPTPITAGVPPAYLANLTQAVAGGIGDLDVSLFLGPNNNAKRARQITMAGLVFVASQLIQNGNYNAALALLTIVENRIDGASPPPDWMGASPARNSLHADIETLIFLVEFL